eukprot:TRINITY_DN1556_c1_g1_i1.p2 TRINITY_DN1556_c1_g1~~TRINITY_DN1556_c1_g1_i1.p2  ORF type:complete len:237 (+),score=42.76 TRINITY_DN1556_c1_g1_i1:723-1433(+)
MMATACTRCGWWAYARQGVPAAPKHACHPLCPLNRKASSLQPHPPQCSSPSEAQILVAMATQPHYKEFTIVGRRKPTDQEQNPPVYRMRVFAPNPVVARARFWYFMRTLKKLKRVNGEVIAFHEIVERNDRVRNYGIWLRYNSRTLTHNMYKEFRDTSRAGAVTQLYQDMAGRHRARLSTIQIIDVKELAAKDCVRVSTQQFHSNKIKFPLPHRVLRAAHKSSKTFLAKRPSTHFH